MLQEIEIDSQESQPELEMEAPQQSKAAALTGAFVQRGRDRAPRVQEVRSPAFLETDAEPLAAVSAPAIAQKGAPPPARRASRWGDALFVAACCAAFFATFLFVLRF